MKEYKKIRENLDYLLSHNKIEDIREQLQNLDKWVEKNIGDRTFHMLFNNMKEAFALQEIITDENNKPIDYKYIEVNPAFEKETGLKKEYVINKKVLEILPDTDKYWIEKYGKVALEGETIEYIHFSKRQDKFYEVKCFSPQKRFFALIFTDITKRKQDELALLASEAALEQLIESSPVATAIYDEKNIIKQLNWQFTKLFGYTIEDIPNVDKWFPLAYPDEGYRAEKIKLWLDHIDEYFKTTVFEPIQAVVTCKDGTQRDIEFNFSAVGKNYITTFIDLTDYNKSKKALAESEERYRMLADNSGDFVGLHDINGYFLYASPSVKKMLGYDPEEVIGSNPYDFFHPDDINAVAEHHKRLNIYTPAPQIEFRYRHKDGHYVWLESTVKLIPDENGKPARILVSNRDISKRKRTEEILEHTRERLRIFTELTTEGIVLDENGKIVDANPSICTMLNISIEEMIGTDIFQFVHDENIEDLIKKWERNTSSTIELKLKTRDGDVFDAQLEAKYLNLYNRNLRVSIVRNITEQLKTQEEIRKLSTAVTQSPASIVITNLEGNIEYVNPQFSKATGYSALEVYGRNPRILKTNYTPMEVYKEMWNKITSGKTWKGEFRNKRKNGSEFWESAIISPIFNDKGQIIKFLAIKEDITAKKDAEEALIKSEKMLQEANATKDKFFSIIAHDLRSPFNTILGFSELLLKNLGNYDFDECQSMIQSIYDSSWKTFNLLDNLLIWSKTQTNKISYSPKGFDIQNVIRRHISFYNEAAGKKEIEIKATCTGDLTVYADVDMVATIMRNLISNAIKFTPRKGIINISAINTEQTHVQISIADTGVGIDKVNLDKLFKVDECHTTKGTEDETGTGLGLVLCKEFVEKNRGTISVTSTPGKGSTFLFTLPSYAPEVLKEQ